MQTWCAYTEDGTRWDEELKEQCLKICDDPEEDSETQERRIKESKEDGNGQKEEEEPEEICGRTRRMDQRSSS